MFVWVSIQLLSAQKTRINYQYYATERDKKLDYECVIKLSPPLCSCGRGALAEPPLRNLTRSLL